MSIITERRLAALTRVYTLCTLDPLPAGLETAQPGFAAQVAALKSSIAGIKSLATAQGAGFRMTAHSTRERKALRRALRDEQLLPLFQSARVLDQTHPGLAQHFQLPFSNAREAQLIIAATTMVREASKPEFMPLFSAQLGADFLDRLNDAIQTINASGDINEEGRRGHIAATTGVNAALAAGRRSVQYLLATVRACCSRLVKTDPVAAAQTLRRFQTAARIERPGKAGQLAVITTSVLPVPANSVATSIPTPPGNLQAAA